MERYDANAAMKAPPPVRPMKKDLPKDWPRGNNGTPVPAGGWRGKPKGAVNKTTRILKDCILGAAERVGFDGMGKDGLLGYLTKVALTDTKSFVSLLGRVLPLQIKAEGSTSIDITLRTVAEVKAELTARGLPVKTMLLDQTPMKVIEEYIEDADVIEEEQAKADDEWIA